MRFNAEDYRGKKVAIHTKSFQEIISFLNNRGKLITPMEIFEDYGSETCFNIDADSYADEDYYRGNGYEILEWKNFMWQSFRKRDIKDGDVIVRRNGDVEIAMIKYNMFITKDGWNDFEYIGEDLTYCDIYGSNGWEEYDIMQVYRPIKKYGCVLKVFDDDDISQVLLYDREKAEEDEEMTVEEICKALGRNIKIVKSKK